VAVAAEPRDDRARHPSGAMKYRALVCSAFGTVVNIHRDPSPDSETDRTTPAARMRVLFGVLGHNARAVLSTHVSRGLRQRQDAHKRDLFDTAR